MIATQKMHHVPANINVFEIQRKAKYHPCSLKFNLPICAVRKICASLPEFENFTGCSKNGPRDFQIFEEYAFYQVRKMVTGLQRKWWFSKTFKKSPIPVTTFEVYRFSLWFYKNSIRWSLPEFTDAPKTERATFKFLKSMCFIKCEKWSLVCSENGDFQNH